ncbi:histidine kinase [Niveispirillum lacus]|uniref:Histidine kinase n=1 Tax=Niveispirillum lacus TaxID=1981099 RepID=A0A255Z1F7_9PROT|nr:FIST N-terminal domain-containing protein [Niveispirillum lacus]OYQ35333.1 histidine kinase [Niveispirillum lacus]
MEDPRDDAPLFASATGTGADWSSAAKDCLNNLTLVPGANFGVLYVTDHLADQLGSVATLLRGVTGVRDWVGTVGLGVLGAGVEIFDRPAVSVLIGRLAAGATRLLGPLTDAMAPLDAATPWLRDHAPLLMLMHGDPRHARLPGLLTDVAGRTGSFIVGGLTASRGEQAVLCGHDINPGLSGIMFDAEVPVATGLSQGCTPIGPVRTVTRSDAHVVMEIDGLPALSVLKADIGPDLAGDLRRIGGLIMAGLPVRGDDRGDRLVRDLTAIDLERGWLAIGETIANGLAIQFCRRDAQAAEVDLDRMLEGLKRRLPTGQAPRAGIYVTCVARGARLFGREGAEIELIHRHLGDFPLTGFAAGGEISNARLYGYTGVLTLFL